MRHGPCAMPPPLRVSGPPPAFLDVSASHTLRQHEVGVETINGRVGKCTCDESSPLRLECWYKRSVTTPSASENGPVNGQCGGTLGAIRKGMTGGDEARPPRHRVPATKVR